VQEMFAQLSFSVTSLRNRPLSLSAELDNKNRSTQIIKG